MEKATKEAVLEELKALAEEDRKLDAKIQSSIKNLTVDEKKVCVERAIKLFKINVTCGMDIEKAPPVAVWSALGPYLDTKGRKHEISKPMFVGIQFLQEIFFDRYMRTGIDMSEAIGTKFIAGEQIDSIWLNGADEFLDLADAVKQKKADSKVLN